MQVFFRLGAAGLLVVMGACATPAVTLKHPGSGATAQCGGGRMGSALGGMIGHGIEKDRDAKCIADYEAKGYRRVLN